MLVRPKCAPFSYWALLLRMQAGLGFHSKCRTLGFGARVALVDTSRRVSRRDPGYQTEEVRFSPGGDRKGLFNRELIDGSCLSLAPWPALVQIPAGLAPGSLGNWPVLAELMYLCKR